MAFKTKTVVTEIDELKNEFNKQKENINNRIETFRNMNNNVIPFLYNSFSNDETDNILNKQKVINYKVDILKELLK